MSLNKKIFIKIKKMKKIFIITMLLMCSWTYSQDKKTTKFEIGLSYSLSGKKAFHNSPISFYGNYQIKKWDKFSVDAGLRILYASSIETNNFTTKWAFNPNVAGSCLITDKLNVYAGLGFYYDSYTFKPSNLNTYTSQDPDKIVSTQGISLTPGLKYFIVPHFFVDTNFTFVFANTKVELSNSSIQNNNTFFNVGLGIAF
jgi:Outer membrane protein beta-barrel domain